MTSILPRKQPVIDFGSTAGLVYDNGRFYDPGTGEQVDPNNRPAPALPPLAAPAPAPKTTQPFALPSFDQAQFQAPAPIETPTLPAPAFVPPQPTFTPPPQQQAPSLPSFADPAVSSVGPAPVSLPFVPAPSGGLIEAQDYSPAPIMPGYAEARPGQPFRSNLFATMGGNPFLPNYRG